MGPHDALLLFPEGGNFTERRRTRSIAKLEELARYKEADLARMRHVLAPQPTEQQLGWAIGEEDGSCIVHDKHRVGYQIRDHVARSSHRACFQFGPFPIGGLAVDPGSGYWGLRTLQAVRYL